LVLTGDDTEEINTITASLHHHLKIKNLGYLTYFLGLEIARNSSGLHLSQRKYTLDLLHETSMLDSAPVATPMTHLPSLSRPRLPSWCWCHFPIQKTPWTSNLHNQHTTRHRLRCPQFKPIHICTHNSSSTRCLTSFALPQGHPWWRTIFFSY